MSVQIESWNRTKQIKESIKYLFNRIFKYGQNLFEWVPLKNNRICCVSLTRKGYVDNMRYVAQALLEKDPNLDIIWITKFPETCNNAQNSGIRVVPYHTVKHFYFQFTARILLSDDSLYSGLIKRRKQVYINVWHGGINYKQLGSEGIYFENALMRKIFALKNPSPDYMVAGSQFFAENMRQAFGFGKTVFLESGLPRNDVLFNNSSLRGKVKKRYHIEDRKIILYAPTFREKSDSSINAMLDVPRLLEAVHKRYGGEWVMLYRSHYFKWDMAFDNKIVIDVSDYEDMQEILIDTDILISDYSSCMWDFSFLDRPIILYVPDEMYYCKKERGLTKAGKEMPYPKSKNMNELVKIVEECDFVRNIDKINKHHKDMGAFDTGNATQYVTDLIYSKIKARK